jgi:hypothetical protein
MRKFETFLVDERLISKGGKVFTAKPHKDTAWWIAFWIFSQQVHRYFVAFLTYKKQL